MFKRVGFLGFFDLFEYVIIVHATASGADHERGCQPAQGSNHA